MADPFYTRHRGPYVLQVNRDTPARKMPWHTETLAGEVSGPDVESEARALLADTRDTIQSVHVWSVSEQQHVGTFVRRSERDGTEEIRVTGRKVFDALKGKS